MPIENIIHMKNGRLAADTPYSSVERVVEEASKNGNVVIHFHGGLVNEENAKVMVNKLTPIYQEAGAFPIFPIWETGLFETISNNFHSLSNEVLYKLVLKFVSNFVKRKLLQREDSRSQNALPNVATTEEVEDIDTSNLNSLSDFEKLTLEAELQQEPSLLVAINSISVSLRDPNTVSIEESARSSNVVRASTETLMDPSAIEKLIDRPNETARGVLSTIKIAKAIVFVASKVIERYIEGREHGFHATIVEEILREFYLANIGGAIWNEMKLDTKESFGDDETIFGGSALLSVLKNKIVSGDISKVTLIGHSTGAVYIGNLLESANAYLPENFAFDIILLAPASTFKFSVDTFVANKNKVNGIRMFTMTDVNEKSDRLVPILYPHSLLYFVSGVVEDKSDTPLIGMERYFDSSHYEAEEFENIKKFKDFLMEFENSVVWSKSSDRGEGLNSLATSHGDFDEDQTTLKSIQHIIKNGF
ncbi:MAG: hypothetical protein MJK12_17105 [Colwellia sp.]|nr:hypothetical protein [Colwellia sp.]